MQNLVSIVADFALDDLDMVQNLSGLNRLSGVGGDLRIKFNNELISLEAGMYSVVTDVYGQV